MGDGPPDFVSYVVARRLTLRRTAYLLCGDWNRAEDLVQDALARLFVHWRRASRAGNVDSYVRRTLVNAYLADQRRPWRREVASDTVPDGVVAGPEPSARAELEQALASLGASQRAVVVLRFWEDLSIQQTADVLNCSVGNVKSQSARGLATLRQVLLASEATDANDTEVST